MIDRRRGSTWGKWDFHIHTPYSLLNNQYGFNPIENPEKFDEYVKELFTRAVEKDIVAIGITDYFSLEGYKRIKEDYLNKTQKMNELFPDGDLLNKIKDIYVFPNIEFRLEVFVGEGNRAVNYHVIFSGDVPVKIIEESFLHGLKIKHTNENTLPLTKANIEIIGKEYKSYNNEENRDDLIVGLEKITINNDNIRDTLKNCLYFKDNYLITIPVDEDLSSIDWNGRDYQTRKNLYRESNLLMTANPKTRIWALAKGREKEQISEFGSIKPCVWGSDAHSYDKMFCPAEERYCWIKAENTYDGLKQILYEPEERVRIQKECPGNKDEHKIINCITFENEDFPKEPIYFSEGLTTIIGGKSTGKSILLRTIANNIDPNQVEDRDQTAKNYPNKLDIPAKIEWKDGSDGEREIVYIPQSWLNKITDEDSSESQLNIILWNLLKQNTTITEKEKSLKDLIFSINQKVKHNIIEYSTAINQNKEDEHNLNTLGPSKAYKLTIDKFEEQKNDLIKAVDITPEKLQKFNSLNEKLSEQNHTLESLEKDKEKLEALSTPFIYIPGMTLLDYDDTPDYTTNDILIIKDKILDLINELNNEILKKWTNCIKSIDKSLDENISEVEKDISIKLNEINPLNELILQNEKLKQIETQISIEKEKFNIASKLEDAIDINSQRIDRLKKQIIEISHEQKDAYDKFAETVSTINTPGTNLSFTAEIKFRRKEFFDCINSLYDNRNYPKFKEKYHFNLNDPESIVINDDFFGALWNGMLDGSLTFKGGNSIHSALDQLFSDWHYIHFAINSDKESIDSMSPGKKALVLLEIIINLTNDKCPILIDQPEDDLDNRSIYTDLVKYLKSKKHERQIIIVTHNANLVIGADAEEIIIANQHGKEAQNHLYKFEYRCGAIENTKPVFQPNGDILPGVLNQKGVQEQICDILEGGKEAFELRRKKYTEI